MDSLIAMEPQEKKTAKKGDRIVVNDTVYGFPYGISE